MNRFVPAAALATLALALTACSDPSEAYTPVDQLPSASDPAGSPPTTTAPTPTPPPVEGDNATIRRHDGRWTDEPAPVRSLRSARSDGSGYADR